MGKDRDQPFFYENPKSNTMVIFLHGILESPRQFVPFAKVAKAAGVSYCAVLLAGHGKSGKAFAASSAAQWFYSAEQKIRKYKDRYKNIILAGHSMGGLLAILLSIKYKRQVKGLVLLAVPLKVFVRGSMVCNGGKVLLRKVEEDDVVASYAKNALSVARGSFCTYMGWIPRYMELLPMIRVVKEQLGRIEVPALIVQSRNDELVSNESIKVYKERLRNEYRIVQLLKSHHFYYDRSELAYVLKEFAVFIDKEKEDRCH